MAPEIPPIDATLPELQSYVQKNCVHHGWDTASDLETFLLFTEEVGEMAKAIRRRRKLFEENKESEKPQELAHEMADIFNYLLDLASRFDVDLISAFREKEEINRGRSWQTNQENK